MSSSTTTTETSGRPAWQTVALREIAVKLRDKNFIISIVVTLLMLIGSFAVQMWMAERTQTTKVAVAKTASSSVSGAQLVAEAQRLAKADDRKVEFTSVPVAGDAAATDAVRSKKADAALVRNGDSWQLQGRKDVDGDLTKYVTQAAAQLTLASNAKAQHVDLGRLTDGATVTTHKLDPGADRQGLAKVVSLVFAFLFYLVALLFGLPIAQSVIEEKQSRIVEILASAIPLKHLLAGKILGNALLAIGQVVLLVGVALIGMSMTKWSEFVGALAGASGWFVVFFLLGFLVVACLFAVAGSLASRSEDVQTTAQPVTMLVLLVLLAGFVLKGTALTVGSFVPVISTIAMPTRLLAGEAAWWEPVLAIILSLVAAVLISRVATRLYTRSVMQTGGRLSYRQAFSLKE